ncbi:MAG: O-methyltransferase [Chitinophagales bacterium]
MKDLVPHDIAVYTETHTSPSIPLLQQLYRETNLKIVRPRNISGNLQGTFLRMISNMMRPKSILEVGTYTGYAAICLAEGLTEGGMLHTIEINEELEDIQQKYFEAAGLQDKIKSYVGNALDIIPQLKETFDLVFIDADKANYPQYFEMILGKLRKGGFIIADNVLWNGKVLDKTAKDKYTMGVKTFNELVQNDERVENVLLTVKDGMMLVRKK